MVIDFKALARRVRESHCICCNADKEIGPDHVQPCVYWHPEKFKIKARRQALAAASNRKAGVWRDVEIAVSIFPKGDRPNSTFKIVDGGVTGFEACYMDDRFVNGTAAEDWSACWGTEGRWDALIVPAAEMRRAWDHFGIAYAAPPAAAS